MFANFRIYIFLFYIVTIALFLAIEYYILKSPTLQNKIFFSVVLGCIVVLAGVFISKLALDPLVEYVKNLQNLSHETLHELNLPISTIITNTQILKKGVSDPKALKRIERIESACDMLKQRYDELDYLIKKQSKQQLKEEVELSEIVYSHIDFLRTLYPHVEFHLTLEPTPLMSDKIGLSKVIDNLIDNGVKYSPNAKDIEISLKNRCLSITDHGIGMDEVELLQVFDNFYQKNTYTQGFGIGLAMVKRFCDENKILLDIKSKPNEGTTVSLQF
ncbi:MAG: HAMP domain-containing histidine kinase [Epsilonproteobacteria bacterium]|nr:HAMP domain-containing histidine kinase [Campylobacterota bacterium]